MCHVGINDCLGTNEATNGHIAIGKNKNNNNNAMQCLRYKIGCWFKIAWGWFASSKSVKHACINIERMCG